MRSLAVLGLAIAAVAVMPTAASAFCGFYVDTGAGKLTSDATQVVLMRKGTRTILSMQNDYRGPAEAFAMVVPVPVVLRQGDVKTLPKDVFARVEGMGAPRLVEYWELDPCMPREVYDRWRYRTMGGGMIEALKSSDPTLGVSVESRFVVGEYQIVILSAKDSTGLETWLVREKYQIPRGAERLLRPYVESGMKFFVAKVDPAKVTFDAEHRAALSPLRFHYDAEDFALPIRLGLASSSGKQDLIVSILAPDQRYEVANYPNVTIPTNIEVRDAVRADFAGFYAALFDRTLARNPGAVVTEYAWAATTCDPCPGPVLGGADFALLGADVLEGPARRPAPYAGANFVLTRLHARYGKDLADDLVFKAAPPISGGRDGDRVGARPDDHDNFQARYIIRHPWTRPVTCAMPRRGIWDGRPREFEAEPATGVAFARRGASLSPLVMYNVPELGLRAYRSRQRPRPRSAPVTRGGIR